MPGRSHLQGRQGLVRGAPELQPGGAFTARCCLPLQLAALTRHQVQVRGHLSLMRIACRQHHAQVELLTVPGLLDQGLHPGLEQRGAIVRAVVRLQTQRGDSALDPCGMLQPVGNALEHPGGEGGS